MRAMKAELAECNEREVCLRSEVQDLEDANLTMSERYQRQLDDFNLMQEDMSRDMQNLKKDALSSQSGGYLDTELTEASRSMRELSADKSRQSIHRNDAHIAGID